MRTCSSERGSSFRPRVGETRRDGRINGGLKIEQVVFRTSHPPLHRTTLDPTLLPFKLSHFPSPQHSPSAMASTKLLLPAILTIINLTGIYRVNAIQNHIVEDGVLQSSFAANEVHPKSSAWHEFLNGRDARRNRKLIDVDYIGERE